ncbi:MAG: hypothetical protein DRP85_00835 [Candidatus Makaraimicrobium thalassicum]|nr:MAG: hypothetical protein DRP85_00835 [Candidatus Omnitrophota bacterium]
MSKKRIGLWQYTLPFSLNVIDGIAFETSTFELPWVGVYPELIWWDLSKSNPSGYRHLRTHEAFLGVVGSGMGQLKTGLVIFDFNDVDIGSGSGVSDTRCLTFRLADRECDTTRVTHMRVWVSDDSDFLIKDYKILYEHSPVWQPNKKFQFADIFDPSKVLPNYLPEKQNLFRCDGGLTIHGSGDADSSEYMYFALAASGTVPVGEYGRTPTSGLRIRVTYSMDNINSLFD